MHPIDFKKLVILALFYGALSFAYSFIGFLHPEFAFHYHEYSFTNLIIEVSGHFLFGFVAAIPFLDFRISLFTGAAAVLIDTDHILSVMDLNIGGRPDHSFLYILISAGVMIFIASRLGFPKSFLVKMLFLAPVVFFAHVSYDIVAQGGTSFQLFIPFSFQTQTISFYYSIPFEGAALILSFIGNLLSRRISVRHLSIHSTT